MIDLAFKDEYQDFREEVRHFIDSNLTEQLRTKIERAEFLDRDLHTHWQKTLDSHGWGAPNWPIEYGGTGKDLKQTIKGPGGISQEYKYPARKSFTPFRGQMADIMGGNCTLLKSTRPSGDLNQQSKLHQHHLIVELMN